MVPMLMARHVLLISFTTFFARIVTFDASPFVAHVGCNCRSNRFGFGDLEQKRNNLSGGTAAN